MPYSVTKAAGVHLMKCLASTQGPKIRVNAILPGLLLTEWVSKPSICFITALTKYRV
jgi:NAD(P)-dependent dehydrogenase (short-subunit alcohol dehydrogenase family)